MSTPSQIDSVEKGLSRLLSQFKGKPLMEAFLSSYLKQLDKTQSDTLYFLNNRSVFNATGSFLDQIGGIVGVKRSGANDSDYRENILTQILINNSEGTPKDVLRILKTITDASEVRMFEHFPANLHLYTDGTTNLNSSAKTIMGAVPASVTDVTIISGAGSGFFNGVFTPSELNTPTSSTGEMATEIGDNIVTDSGDFITLVDYDQFSDINLSLLAELLPDTLEVFDGSTSDVLEVFDGVSVDTLEIFGATIDSNAPPWAEIYNYKF